jgi:protein involved in polysaccharide export with SLBB domain
LTNVLFATGGVSKIGSLRNIQVKRQGKLVSNYDFYKTLFEGNTSQDIKLQDGDTIFIPLLKKRALVEGAVLKPGFYEVKDNDSLLNLIDLAGKKSQQIVSLEYNTYEEELGRRVSRISLLKDENNSLIKDGDVITLLDNRAAIISTIELRGEFKYPGVYSIESNDTLYDLIMKAGGLTDEAYTEGSIFTRKSIAKIEKESYKKNADNLERSLVNSASLGNPLESSAYIAISDLIQKLRDFEPIGRQVVTVDPYMLKTDPRLNFTLQDGDVLIVPQRTGSVSVVGEVLNPISHRYNEELNIEDYLRLSGGLTEGADKNQIFIINPNGQAELYKNRLFGRGLSKTLLPGSTIVVTRNLQPFDWLKLTSIITPILSDLAVSAAAIAAISDNN